MKNFILCLCLIALPSLSVAASPVCGQITKLALSSGNNDLVISLSSGQTLKIYGGDNNFDTLGTTWKTI